jgi:hypothetical protein
MSEELIQSDGYYSVDLPGLTEENAERVVRWSEANGYSRGSYVAPPGELLTQHLDKATVGATVRAFQIALSTDQLLDEAVIVEGVLEAMVEWLKDASD